MIWVGLRLAGRLDAPLAGNRSRSSCFLAVGVRRRPVTQARAGTAAVRIQKLHPGSLQGFPQGSAVAQVRHAFSALKTSDCVSSDARCVGELRLRPIEEGAGGAALFGSKVHLNLIVANQLTAADGTAIQFKCSF